MVYIKKITIKWYIENSMVVFTTDLSTIRMKMSSRGKFQFQAGVHEIQTGQWDIKISIEISSTVISITTCYSYLNYERWKAKS